MIRLFKGEEPKVLADNAADWLQNLSQHAAKSTKPSDSELSRYNHPDIKNALKSETHGKCAYCEAKFEHVTYGDVEHISPKKTDPHLRFTWDNLTVACNTCNTNKGSKVGVIDPYNCDPETRFFVSGPMIFALPNDSEALVTGKYLQLNRPRLVERRAERVKALHDLILLAASLSNPTAKQAILDEMKINETKTDREFAATARSYIKEAQEKGYI